MRITYSAPISVNTVLAFDVPVMAAWRAPASCMVKVPPGGTLGSVPSEQPAARRARQQSHAGRVVIDRSLG